MPGVLRARWPVAIDKVFITLTAIVVPDRGRTIAAAGRGVPGVLRLLQAQLLEIVAIQFGHKLVGRGRLALQGDKPVAESLGRLAAPQILTLASARTQMV